MPGEGFQPMSKMSVEIERTYLLDRLPDLPTSGGGAVAVRMEQGYLAEDGGGRLEGRLRRTLYPDGRVVCTHTIKRGSGLVRSEIERHITPEEFEDHWPNTAGRRLTKTRHFVKQGDLVWEIDDFDDLGLVLAEVELPDAATVVTPPPWLAPHIVRDVTDEKQYRNYELALELARQRAQTTGGAGGPDRSEGSP